ncbi:excalibur calcium-binding domain-containing protein [Sphingomonas limnosediminicola]|jgi:hypothetical protein
MRAIFLLAAAVILGLTGGYAWSKWSNPASSQAALPSVADDGSRETAEEVQETVHFDNCAAVRAAGKAPLFPGHPGYSKDLDPDGDGVACPP